MNEAVETLTTPSGERWVRVWRPTLSGLLQLVWIRAEEADQ